MAERPVPDLIGDWRLGMRRERRVQPQASCCDDFLALLAEAFDAERDDIADIEELRRLHVR